MSDHRRNSFQLHTMDEDPLMEIASLNLEEESPPVRRSQRRRSGIFENTLRLSYHEDTKMDEASPKTTPTSTDSAKRRVVKNPRKRKDASDCNLALVKEYYLCKKFKRMPNTFETIYEEPIVQKNKVLTVGARKMKRLLNFDGAMKEKEKKRRLKIKKKLPNQRFMKRKRLTMDYFLAKMRASAEPEVDDTASTSSSL